MTTDGRRHRPAHQRYSAFPLVALPDRGWPGKTIASAPRWLSTDLRDGNQALPNPMCLTRRLAMFKLLVEMGYKEIEVGFPTAGKDDYDFVRLLIEKGLIPDDVRISTLVPARDELIRRTVQCLVGAPSATIHLYNATAPVFRRIVFGVDRAECKDLAVQGARLVLKYADELLGECDLGFQYSPELFNETELEFALEVCEAVMDVWQPDRQREIVLNLPTTVERSLPNVFADQVEWMHRNLSRREHVCLSIHPHNDRGTAVAAAELALLAGAQRIEGCLFGSGERTGNVCLVTLGMNLFAQGIDPRIDFSDINRVRRTVEYCNQMAIHPRHPYGGDLVYTAFSGSHQDAIKKGFEDLERRTAEAGTSAAEARWEMPYLPIDPKDVGRSYAAIIRVTSQSGKSGMAHVMRTRHALQLPRGLQIDFACVVQAFADQTQREVTPEQLWQVFADEYLLADELPMPPPRGAAEDEPAVAASLYVDGRTHGISAEFAETFSGIEAELRRTGIAVLGVYPTWPSGPPTVGAEADTGAEIDTGIEFAVYAECGVGEQVTWGVGIDSDVVAASRAAVRSALRRAARRPGSRPSREGSPSV
jgi:2-isopropylmalate synthase